LGQDTSCDLSQTRDRIFLKQVSSLETKMPVYNAADARWGDPPVQSPVVPAQPVGGLGALIPAGMNPHSAGGKFTYESTTQDAMVFILRSCRIDIPEDYEAKTTVNSTGNVTHYMQSSQINIIARALTIAGFGQKASIKTLAGFGTFKALQEREDGRKNKVWEEYLQPWIAYIFEHNILGDGFLGTKEDIMTASLKQCYRHACTTARVEGKVWSFEYIKALMDDRAVYATYCVGHNYQVAQIWNEMMPGFLDRLKKQGTKDRLVTAEQSRVWFRASNKRRRFRSVDVTLNQAKVRSANSKRRRGVVQAIPAAPRNLNPEIQAAVPVVVAAATATRSRGRGRAPVDDRPPAVVSPKHLLLFLHSINKPNVTLPLKVMPSQCS